MSKKLLIVFLIATSLLILCSCGAPTEEEISNAVKDTFPDSPKIISVDCLDYGDESDCCTIEITVEKFSEDEEEAQKQYKAVNHWVDCDKPDNVDYPGFEDYSIGVNMFYSGDDYYERDTDDTGCLTFVKNGEEVVYRESEEDIFGEIDETVESTTPEYSHDESDMTEVTDNDLKTHVWVCAQDVAEQSLKSPRKAKFCSINEASVYSLGNKQYMAMGYVDAQNSFGAEVRTNFCVWLTKTKNGYKDGYVEFDE